MFPVFDIIRKNRDTDVPQMGFSLVALSFAVAALLWEIGWIGVLSIIAIDLFVVGLIVCTAVKSTPKCRGGDEETWPYLPTRPAALIMLPILLIGLVTAFAGVYLWSAGITVGTALLSGRIDALYFSAVTITTLGYGDFLPTNSCAKVAVMGQLASGFIMLVGALPLLVGRLSMWSR
jgi:voltage-gated potassium channel Kch